MGAMSGIWWSVDFNFEAQEQAWKLICKARYIKAHLYINTDTMLYKKMI